MVTFTYNSVDYQFRNPDLGNIDEISFQRVNRRTRGGDLVIFRDAEWPKTEVLNLNFTFPNETDGIRLLNFVQFTLGEIIQYRDHENRLWSGVIQNPNAELVQTGRSSWALNLLFEGDQV